LEDGWQSVVTSAGALNEKHRQQQTAIWELLSTEVAYIRTLRVITDVSITHTTFADACQMNAPSDSCQDLSSLMTTMGAN